MTIVWSVLLILFLFGPIFLRIRIVADMENLYLKLNIVLYRFIVYSTVIYPETGLLFQKTGLMSPKPYDLNIGGVSLKIKGLFHLRRADVVMLFGESASGVVLSGMVNTVCQELYRVNNRLRIRFVPSIWLNNIRLNGVLHVNTCVFKMLYNIIRNKNKGVFNC